MAVVLVDSPRTNLHALPEQQSLHLPCSVSPTRLLPALLNSPPGTARCSTSGQKRPLTGTVRPNSGRPARPSGSTCGSTATSLSLSARTADGRWGSPPAVRMRRTPDGVHYIGNPRGLAPRVLTVRASTAPLPERRAGLREMHFSRGVWAPVSAPVASSAEHDAALPQGRRLVSPRLVPRARETPRAMGQSARFFSKASAEFNRQRELGEAGKWAFALASSSMGPPPPRPAPPESARQAWWPSTARREPQGSRAVLGAAESESITSLINKRELQALLDTSRSMVRSARYNPRL